MRADRSPGICFSVALWFLILTSRLFLLLFPLPCLPHSLPAVQLSLFPLLPSSLPLSKNALEAESVFYTNIW